MEMEWIDGYDLRRLLTTAMLDRIRERVERPPLGLPQRRDRHGRCRRSRGSSRASPSPCSATAWRRWRPCTATGSSTATSSRRTSCSSGRATPSSSTSARPSSWTQPAARRTCTPSYAAPEVLEGAEGSPQSDLASLGYVLIELLAGAPPFAGLNGLARLARGQAAIAAPAAARSCPRRWSATSC